jgi:hypothetical protein
VIRLGTGLLFALAVPALGCGGAADAGKGAASRPPPSRASIVAFPREEARWPKFHSVRFRLSVPLPDGKSWKIDDHSQAELHAAHDATQSRLVLFAWNDSELMNRAKCEERARARGLVPDGLVTVDDDVTVGPEAYDTRVWVTAMPGRDAKAPLLGHVFAFGAFVRRCLFVDFQSEVASGQDGETLSSRLALVKVRLLGGLTLDPPRTTPDADIPPEKRPLPKGEE